jgi:hypothetical protein
VGMYMTQYERKCMQVLLHIYARVYDRVCMCIHVCMCACVCVCVCVCVCDNMHKSRMQVCKPSNDDKFVAVIVSLRCTNISHTHSQKCLHTEMFKSAPSTVRYLLLRWIFIVALDLKIFIVALT